jgi:hypothetical protein
LAAAFGGDVALRRRWSAFVVGPPKIPIRTDSDGFDQEFRGGNAPAKIHRFPPIPESSGENDSNGAGKNAGSILGSHSIVFGFQQGG